MGVFWSRGYHATALPDLLRATKLSRGSLYAAFGDKHSLFLRALDRYIANALTRLDIELDPRREPADVIYVNAGASRPADAWLDGLKEGGRLILPLTTARNFAGPLEFSRPSGAVFRITRRGGDYDADFVGPIAVFPCEGMRDEASEQVLAAAFDKGGYRDVKRLRRTDDVPGEDCWVKASGWSLTYH